MVAGLRAGTFSTTVSHCQHSTSLFGLRSNTRTKFWGFSGRPEMWGWPSPSRRRFQRVGPTAEKAPGPGQPKFFGNGMQSRLLLQKRVGQTSPSGVRWHLRVDSVYCWVGNNVFGIAIKLVLSLEALYLC